MNTKKNQYLRKIIRKYLNENLNVNNEIIAYHGTNSIFPFQNFKSELIGSGHVSTGIKYGGFFFTTEKENAEYYTEYFVAKVKINNVINNPTDIKNPKLGLEHAIENNENYLFEDIFDGNMFSDIVVVPKNNIKDIAIIDWEFIGDEDELFEQYDDFFGENEEDVITKDMIKNVLFAYKIDLGFILNIPIFEEYFNSKV